MDSNDDKTFIRKIMNLFAEKIDVIG
jgi:hypothetical protein